MSDDRTKIIPRGTPESAAMVAAVRRAMTITPVLNALTYGDTERIRAVFSELIGAKVDESVSLIPPPATFSPDCTRAMSLPAWLNIVFRLTW